MKSALLLVLAVAGCFRPQITDGGFQCNLVASPACPDGFTCDRGASPPACWQGPHDSGAGDQSDATAGVGEFGACIASSECAAGLVCVADTCGSRCYRRCSSDDGCPGATCSRPVPGGGRACDMPPADCNPLAWAGGGQVGCRLAATACYASVARGAQTVCDCPGGGRIGDPCALPTDCLVGLLCADPTGTGMRTCQQTCAFAASNCAPKTCKPYVGADGAINPTYGFCY